MIKVNRKAQQEAINKAYDVAKMQAQAAADLGQECVTLYFRVPNCEDETEVMKRMNAIGVYCEPRGCDYDKNKDGSFSYRISCQIGNDPLNRG